jgi:SAM-dependent methyltransferase
MEMPIAADGVAHAVSVWVVHSVADPVRLFTEAARVLRPGGRYVVCTGQRPAPGDAVGMILKEMTARVDVLRGASRPRGVTVDEMLVWAGQAGFDNTVHQLDRQWHSSPSEELVAITQRSWPALRELDEAAIEEATRPAIEALEALPDENDLRRATADMLVLSQS